MAALRAALKAFLSADTTLATYLTGGVFDADDVFRDGKSASAAPRETNGVTLKPFAAIRWRVSNPSELIARSERRNLEIWVYQHAQHATIEQAKARMKAILDRTIIASDDFGMGMFHWLQDLGEFPADELGNAAGDRMRWFVDVTRK